MGLARSPRYLFIFVCFLLIGIWGTAKAFTYGSASLSFYRVKNILADWQTQGNQQSEEQYLLAKNAIENALSNHGSNPLYIDIMAQIYEWGAIAEYEERSVALAQAKHYYLQATKVRPSWPVTWASLAMIKWRFQEFDEELLNYLERADRFGPYKPEVHILFSELGLALYENNHPMLLKIRNKFYNHLALGLRNPRTRQLIIEKIESRDLEKQVCRWLRNEKEWTIRLLEECSKQNNYSKTNGT